MHRLVRQRIATRILLERRGVLAIRRGGSQQYGEVHECGALMIDDTGIFRTTIAVAHVARTDERRTLPDVMVDTASEYNWIPRRILEDLGVERERIDRFETADGRVLERAVGFARIFAGARSAPAAVVFADPGDMVLLGAHGLEGLNLRIDLGRKELVPRGRCPSRQPQCSCEPLPHGAASEGPD